MGHSGDGLWSGACEAVKVVLYFALLLFSLARVLLLVRQKFNGMYSRRRLLLGVAAVALAVTWYGILAFVYNDYRKHSEVEPGSWLRRSTLFEDAYRLVVDSPRSVWWSTQLLMTVPSVVLLIYVQGFNPVDALSFVVLGFLGAISVATPLFLFCSRGSLLSRSSTYPPPLRLSVPLALGTIGMVLLVLFAHSTRFATTLYLVHGLLLLPFVLPQRPHVAHSWVAIGLAYFAVAAFFVHVSATRAVLGEDGDILDLLLLPLREFRNLVGGSYDLCTFSIAFDAVFLALSLVLWVRLQPGWRFPLPMLVAALYLCPSVALPLIAAFGGQW